MEIEELKKLFKKYHEGTCTEEEKALLEAWYLQFNEHDLDISSHKIKAISNKIWRELPGNHHSFLRIGIKLATAAVLLGFLVTACLKFINIPVEKKQASYSHNILPGSDNAILMLSNGKKINLNKATNGQLAIQPGIQILKTAGGQITYKIAKANTNSANSSTNTIITPKGGQWQVILPDGSKVWLNSASSLSYPTTFIKQKKRIVQLDGEAYFEVAKDKLHPFIVRTNQQIVEVLGTHFNINAYADEPLTKTTLSEGHVKVSLGNGQIKFLLPGQQADLKNNQLTLSAANIEEALAWKNGYFRFNDENIQSIMRKLCRWYNIEVHYDGDIPNEGMNGKISRFKPIDQVLNALEATKTVHFKVEGRRVIVMR